LSYFAHAPCNVFFEARFIGSLLTYLATLTSPV